MFVSSIKSKIIFFKMMDKLVSIYTSIQESYPPLPCLSSLLPVLRQDSSHPTLFYLRIAGYLIHSVQ